MKYLDWEARSISSVDGSKNVTAGHQTPALGTWGLFVEIEPIVLDASVGLCLDLEVRNLKCVGFE